MKIPFVKAIINPLGILGDNIKNFVIIGGVYGLVLTVLAYFLGVTYACTYANNEPQFFYCSSYGWEFFVYEALKFFVFACFIKSWADVVFEKQKFAFNINWQELKVFLLLVVFLGLFLLPLVSLYFLYTRVPNPDWRIEISYFAVVSVGFWVPFFVLRFFGLIGFAAASEKLVSLKEVWSKTSGSTFRIMMFLFVLLLIAFLLFGSFNSSFASIANNFSFINVVFVGFIYNVLSLLVLAIFANHCILMKDFIKGEK